MCGDFNDWQAQLLLFCWAFQILWQNERRRRRKKCLFNFYLVKSNVWCFTTFYVFDTRKFFFLATTVDLLKYKKRYFFDSLLFCQTFNSFLNVEWSCPKKKKSWRRKINVQLFKPTHDFHFRLDFKMLSFNWNKREKKKNKFA